VQTEMLANFDTGSTDNHEARALHLTFVQQLTYQQSEWLRAYGSIA